MNSSSKDIDVALADRSVSLFDEMVAYEALWNAESESLKTIAAKFSDRDILPSDLLAESAGLLYDQLTAPVAEFLSRKRDFSVLLRGCFQYPPRLRDARHPIQLFYYRGDVGLLESRAVAVVGARDSTPAGQEIAQRISEQLVRSGYTVASGLARGIDTVALRSALNAGGRVIAVIGTPIDECYPKENCELQHAISHRDLLVSHVPFFRYHNEPFPARRIHFPIRNSLMSAISLATVIVEASDRSGTLTQARACLEQGRLLCITENCFRNPNITWPAKYIHKGALKVSSPADIVANLKARYGS